MSLFGTIQKSANALQVSELGLNVVGNNIANANTPGYIRQELVQASAFGSKRGDIIQGLGVRAIGVVQKVDEFTLESLRQAESALASSDALTEIYSQLESVFGELTDNDLSTQLSEFSSSVQDVLNQPGNDALRRLVVERGVNLSSNVRNLSQRFSDVSSNINDEVRGAASEINRLTKQIATLNRRIVELEGGRASGSDAVGLRDERITALQELSRIVNIRSVEQDSGAVTVFVGGEYLVADGIQRPVEYGLKAEGDFTAPEVRLADTNSPLQLTGGRLHGIYSARDQAIGDGADSLDQFARDLIETFNVLHTQGQGLRGFSQVVGTNATDDRLGPLDLAGFPTRVKNGEFEIVVQDLDTGATKTHSIKVSLTGLSDDTSLEDVRAEIDAISGLSAEINPDGQLRIDADTQSLRFSFQNDTSNFLTANGINTFFVGASASDLEVNERLIGDPGLFAASLTGVGAATDNALRMAEAFDTPLATLNGKSIKQSYEDIVVRTTQDINVQKGVSDGLRNYYRTLESRHLATSGVNLDEEAVKMIYYQRAFQANSRVIQASNEMLEVLVNL